MEIIQQLVSKKHRFKVVISSEDLVTHSAMQSLEVEDIQLVRHDLLTILKGIDDVLDMMDVKLG